ncbi:DUF2784 domain-containing protein [Thalassoglobus sp. JC818]|uniref:DUF2784 domain-containing protein n=1 Tax=Thalassoglobus sp. JC818 TaxID=3232136 RepID=UPI0034593413
MNESNYALLADLVAVVHLAYAATIVIGLLLVLCGGIAGWKWVRNRWFRIIHLLMILIVVAEAWAGVTCPLTTLEESLRAKANQPFDGDGFLAGLVHQLLFFDAPWWVFTMCYTVCGLLILVSLSFVPPDWSSRKTARRLTN